MRIRVQARTVQKEIKSNDFFALLKSRDFFILEGRQRDGDLSFFRKIMFIVIEL